MPTTYSGGVPSVNVHDGSIPKCRITIFNGYSEFKDRQLLGCLPRVGGGPRSSIKVFSARARKLMLKRLFSLSTYPSLFITLTYPRIYPADSEEWKRHLDNFFRSLRREFPESWFFWKLEPQKRGAPHFHLLGELGPEVNIHLLRTYISHLWFRVCGTGDPKHLRAGTQVDLINDSEGKMRAYVCKYVGKAETGVNYADWERPGQFWGVRGRKNLPPALANILELPEYEFARVKRLLRRWLKRLSPSSRSYANRMKAIPSFHLLAPHHVICKLVEFVTSLTLPPPTLPTPEQVKGTPQPIFN